MDHVVRRSLPEQSGRRRENCANGEVRSSPTTAGRCGKPRCRGKRKRGDRRQRELVLTKVGMGIRSSSPEFGAVAFSAIDSARRKSGHPVVQRQRSMIARCQRTQDVAPRDGLSSLRRLHRRTFAITGIAPCGVHQQSRHGDLRLMAWFWLRRRVPTRPIRIDLVAHQHTTGTSTAQPFRNHFATDEPNEHAGMIGLATFQ